MQRLTQALSFGVVSLCLAPLVAQAQPDDEMLAMAYDDAHTIRLAADSAQPLAAQAKTSEETDDEMLAMAYGDQRMVRIATGSLQPLRRAPSVASVITADDIAAMGATDLDQVLETVPGLHVSRRVGSYTSQYVIRGIGANNILNPQVLMLENGVPLNTTYTGDKGLLWAGLPLENVARIEIIRGPGSALYGADAYAGVINIITKTAADAAGTQAGLRAGSFNSRDGWLPHGGKLGPMDVAAYLRVGSTDGQKRIITADAQTRLDTLFATNASRAPGPVSTGYDAVDATLDLAHEQWRWRSGYKLRDHVGTGAGVASALDPTSTSKGEWITSDLSWTEPKFATDWSAGAVGNYLYYADLNQRVLLFPAGATFPTGTFPEGVIGGPSRWERQFRVSAYALYTGFTGHQVRVGLGHDDLDLYRVETWKNYLLSPAGVPIPTGAQIDYSEIQPHTRPHRRLNSYLYAQDEWSFATDWTLTAGLRHDRYSDFGSTTNPRLALVWDAAQDLTAKLLYGQAFRAPALAEQFAINPVANGNPDLQPETIRTLEAVLQWQATPDAHVNLSAFRYNMRDVIVTVPNPAPAPGATFQNAGRQHGQGTELELVWDARRDLRLNGNYSYQHSIDESTDQDVGYAPHHHLYARAEWRPLAQWQASAQVNHVASRARAAGDARPPIANYTTLDLTLRSNRGQDRWAFAASVFNLFNADVREPSFAPGTAIPNDLPMAPRSVWLQASCPF